MSDKINEVLTQVSETNAMVKATLDTMHTMSEQFGTWLRERTKQMGLFDGTISKFGNKLCTMLDARATTRRESAQAAKPGEEWQKMRDSIVSEMLTEVASIIRESIDGE